MKKLCDTIIIGGGVAGLSCAKQLSEHNKEFVLITENIGGRVKSSEDGSVNYGAFYVMENYHYMKQYVICKQKIDPFKLIFHRNHERYAFHLQTILRYPLQYYRLTRILKTFLMNYEEFKKDCQVQSQKEGIEQNQYLKELYYKPTQRFIQENNIQELVHTYLSEVLYATTFLPIHKLNSFTFLQLSLPVIMPNYEFTWLPERMITYPKEKIIRDSVRTIRKEKKEYRITTPKTIFSAKNLVLATPPHITQKLLHLKKIKKPTSAHMFHLKGILRKNWEAEQIDLFSERSPIYAIANVGPDSYLLYSKKRTVEFSHYFSSHTLIKHHFWNPAFNLEGDVLLDAEPKENLFIIGDHNVCGMEDACITGLYAANQIISRS